MRESAGISVGKLTSAGSTCAPLSGKVLACFVFVPVATVAAAKAAVDLHA